MSKPSFVQIWLTAVRPKTLLAALAPILVGSAMAVASNLFHPLAALLALLGAVFIQIGTNFYNDFADYEKGADTEDRKGPTRVTQAGWVQPQTMKQATILVFFLAVVAGGYLMWRGGWPIIIIGVLSIVSGIMYTAGKHSLAYIGLGDLFVLVFFGPVAVGGTYYVQALELPLAVLIAGLAPGFLSVAILLVNNIRDQVEDRLAGKKTMIVRFGRRFGVACYFSCILATAIIPVILFFITPGKHWVLMASSIAIPGLLCAVSVMKTPPGKALNPLLGKTAGLLLLYSILFALTWNL